MNDLFFRNHQTMLLEYAIESMNSFDEFEQRFTDDFLNEDTRTGDYLQQLLFKYDKDAATVSFEAGLNRSYVGNIVRGVKNNPGRDALIGICLAIGTDIEEVQHLLKYAGHAPLYVRRKRDVIIWFGFMKHRSVMEVDMDLEQRGYKTFLKY